MEENNEQTSYKSHIGFWSETFSRRRVLILACIVAVGSFFGPWQYDTVVFGRLSDSSSHGYSAFDNVCVFFRMMVDKEATLRDLFYALPLLTLIPCPVAAFYLVLQARASSGGLSRRKVALSSVVGLISILLWFFLYLPRFLGGHGMHTIYSSLNPFFPVFTAAAFITTLLLSVTRLKERFVVLLMMLLTVLICLTLILAPIGINVDFIQ